jgi:hypothetical protein
MELLQPIMKNHLQENDINCSKPIRGDSYARSF